MPKLNVQQNNQNIIQAFRNALAIGRLKGIIASDGNHNFSTAGSNRNLLDNPWFTINQRGQSSYTTISFGVDRWTFSGSDSNHTITINADKSVTINGLFYQKKEYYLQVGEAVTISYMTADGNIVSRTGTIPASQGFAVGSSDFGLYWRKTGVADFQIWANNLNLRAVKLEKGTVSTLANDAPPEYATELRKCQYYFERIKATDSKLYLSMGFSNSSGTYVNTELIAAPKRAKPSITRSGTVTVGQASSGSAITAIGINGGSYESGHFSVSVAASATANSPYRLFLDTGSYIDLSADL